MTKPIVAPIGSLPLVSRLTGPLVLAHVGLGLAADRSEVVATTHALSTLALGLVIALTTRHKVNVARIAAYIVGAEVFWRMSSANVPYEIAKYALSAIFLLALTRFYISPRTAGLPLLYLALLAPSTWMTVDALGFTNEARELISFNMSGPLALAVSIIFFRQCRFGWREIRSISWCLIAPIASVGSIALLGLMTADSVSFAGTSSLAASGGFGPNQVSAVLGLGATLAIIIAVRERSGHRAGPLLLALWFLSQASLTFSRGGLYNVVVALTLAATQYIRHSRYRVAFAGMLLVVGFLGAYSLVPRLDAFTRGQLYERYQDLDTTNRLEYAALDVEIFFRHLPFGVGPGVAATLRDPYFPVAAHTEYSRALAEHGIAGALALACLLAVGLRSLNQADSYSTRAWVLLTLGWALVEMAHSATRVAAVPFLFGIATVAWREESERHRIVQARQTNSARRSRLDAGFQSGMGREPG